MRRLLLAAALIAAAVVLPRVHVAAASPVDGLWDAVIVAGGADRFEAPFRFEIATKGTEAEGFFFEGDRTVGSTSGRFADGTLTLDYEFLNTTLELKLNGDQLIGTYLNRRAG